MNNVGTILIIIGVLFLIAALIIVGFNVRSQKNAGDASQVVMEQIYSDWEKEGIQNNQNSTKTTSGQQVAGEEIKVNQPLQTSQPYYVVNPDILMFEKKIDGKKYIGVISIPILGLELPVNTEWNYTNLKVSPCRYSGSAYARDIIICAHNYDTHFGNLKYLEPRDVVVLTDMEGNVFEYEVAYIETLEPYDVDKLKSGDWDLTLFTCTQGGAARVTVRCYLI